jgi:uncharacterized protein YcfL
MTRTLIVILASLMLVGCITKPSVSHYENIPIGSSKEYTCEQYTLIWANNRYRGSSTGNNALCRYDFQGNYSYFPAFKTEIITNDNRVFYVFEDVDSKMSCAFFGCSLGNGRLKIITRDINEARAATNPNEWAEHLEKKRIQQNILAEKEKLEAAKEAKKLKDKEEYEKKVKLEYLDKAYGKKCLTKKNNISDYNTCLFNQERVVLAEKQEQDRKVNKAKLEEQNKLSTMPPSERYAYTCEKTYGFKKGSDNFRDCVFKIMTTEYEMQRASDQRRITELESKINNNNSNYNSELLEIERLKAKALQDQADAVRNRNQTDALMDLSRSLLNNNNRAPANVPNLPLNCRSVRVGNTVQTQCY